MRAARARPMALAIMVALPVLALATVSALSASAAVTPDPVGVGAWGAGLALLADHVHRTHGGLPGEQPRMDTDETRIRQQDRVNREDRSGPLSSLEAIDCF